MRALSFHIYPTLIIEDGLKKYATFSIKNKYDYCLKVLDHSSNKGNIFLVINVRNNDKSVSLGIGNF